MKRKKCKILQVGLTRDQSETATAGVCDSLKTKSLTVTVDSEKQLLIIPLVKQTNCNSVAKEARSDSPNVESYAAYKPYDVMIEQDFFSLDYMLQLNSPLFSYFKAKSTFSSCVNYSFKLGSSNYKSTRLLRFDIPSSNELAYANQNRNSLKLALRDNSMLFTDTNIYSANCPLRLNNPRELENIMQVFILY